jgi:anti-sigma regulatory factor (Ser/Thr protein kinase)
MDWYLQGDDPSAASELRREIVAHLRGSVAHDTDLDGAALVIGELLSNVVCHAPGPATVRLDWTGKRPVLEVHDLGPGFQPDSTALPADRAQSTGGRGLYLVSEVAISLTVARSRTGGSNVRVELPVTRRTGT